MFCAVNIDVKLSAQAVEMLQSFNYLGTLLQGHKKDFLLFDSVNELKKGLQNALNLCSNVYLLFC